MPPGFERASIKDILKRYYIKNNQKSIIQYNGHYYEWSYNYYTYSYSYTYFKFGTDFYDEIASGMSTKTFSTECNEFLKTLPFDAAREYIGIWTDIL